jgi:hypothetical protein
MHTPVLIFGSGPAGLTAALYAARANLEPVVIRGLQPDGLFATTDEVENYPGFPDAIGGFDLADKMETQAARFGTTFIDGIVERVNLQERPFSVVVDQICPHDMSHIWDATPRHAADKLTCQVRPSVTKPVGLCNRGCLVLLSSISHMLVIQRGIQHRACSPCGH